ncbi:MAG TPA: outer membrane protein [Xanthobacteraceae bacterium]
MKWGAIVGGVGLAAVASWSAALSGASTANAADMTPAVKAPVGSSYIPAQFMWTGYYIGASAGWGSGHSDFTDPFTLTSTASPSLSGFLVGGVTGINYQIGSVVLGAEGDFTGSWAKGSAVDASGNMLKTEVMWTSTVAARIGWAFDRLMIYAKGGGAFDQDRNTAFLPSGANDIGSTYRAGWNVGGGVEFAVTEHWIARFAYDYLKFSAKNLTFQGNAVPPVVNGSVGVTLNEFKAIMAYKF